MSPRRFLSSHPALRTSHYQSSPVRLVRAAPQTVVARLPIQNPNCSESAVAESKIQNERVPSRPVRRCRPLTATACAVSRSRLSSSHALPRAAPITLFEVVRFAPASPVRFAQLLAVPRLSVLALTFGFRTLHIEPNTSHCGAVLSASTVPCRSLQRCTLAPNPRALSPECASSNAKMHQPVRVTRSYVSIS